jgi:hypothetical protein
MLKRYNQHIVTGTLNTVSNAAVTGASLFLGMQSDKVAEGTLSAYLILTAATASLTITPSWQVSNDGSTWTTVKLNSLNTAAIAVATGAQNVTTAIEPPRMVHGYQWARCLLNVAGATGGASDLYSVGYSYKQPD